MFEKIITFLKALYLVSVTIFWFAIIDYNKIFETTVSILAFCLVSGILIIWSFYYIHKFCKVMEIKSKEGVTE